MVVALQPTPHETLTNRTFDALLWALSRPGEIRRLPTVGIETIAEALCDRETGLYCSDDAMALRLRRTGVRYAALGEADYVLINGPTDAETAALLSRVGAGSMLYPETGATILMLGKIGEGTELRLSGPGIAGSTTVAIGDIAPAFWTVRQTACRYPLGWDVFIVDDDRLLGLPRSTRIEVL